MLTDATIRAAMREAQATGKSRTLADAGQRGDGRLVVMIRPGEASPLVELYSRQISGKKRTHTKLGNFPALSLAKAREKHRELVPVIREGESIRHHLASQRQARRELGTLGELVEAYAAHLERDGRRSAPEVRRCLSEATNSAARMIGADRPACDVTPGDVADWLRPIHKTAPAAADQYRRWLSAAFNHATRAEHDYRTEAGQVRRWGIVANPAAAVPADTAARRAGTRHLSADELRRVLAWLADGSAGRTDSRACDALRLIAMTGQRVEEVLSLKAGQYAGGWLRWDSTKTGTPHAIPLPGPARLMLDSLTPNRWGLFFPGLKYPAQPFPARSLDWITRRCADGLGIPRFCPRDLRRTWRTLAADAGLSAEACARLQNHTWGSRVAAKHYDRSEHAALKVEAVRKWEVFLSSRLLNSVKL